MAEMQRLGRAKRARDPFRGAAALCSKSVCLAPEGRRRLGQHRARGDRSQGRRRQSIVSGHEGIDIARQLRKSPESFQNIIVLTSGMGCLFPSG